MPFYLTGDPVPSADMRNVFDNAQHLDFAMNDITSALWKDRFGRNRMSWFGLESALSAKLTDIDSQFASQKASQNEDFHNSQAARENDFSSSQIDKESRFQQFLLNSGYQFLGDYEKGPWKFSSRNQYIRYDGQYWRLGSSSPDDFATTGITKATFEVDKLSLVLMDGDVLRQEMAGSDGLKFIGKCGSLEDLRKIEPTFSGQSIKLERAVDGGPLINIELTHNPIPSDTVDNGYCRFVTVGGNIWDADISSGYDIRLAGYVKSKGNIAECLQKIVDSVVSRIVTSGNYNTQEFLINIYGDDTQTNDSPHIVSQTIKMPQFCTLKFHGGKHMFVAGGDFPCFKIDNAQFFASHGLTWAIGVGGYGTPSRHKSNGFKKVIFDSPQGVTIIGLGKDASNGDGVIYGQIEDVTGSVVSSSDTSLGLLFINNYNHGLRLGTINTYNLYLDDVYIDGITYGLIAESTVSKNSGETVHVRGGTIGAGYTYGTDGRAIYINTLAFNLSISQAHLDYSSVAVIRLGPRSTYSCIRVRDTWIEGFDKLIECNGMYAGRKPHVYLVDCEFECRQADNVARWGGPRQIFDSGEFYALTVINPTFVFFKKPGKNCQTIALAGLETKGFSKIDYGSGYLGATDLTRLHRPYPIDIYSSIRGLGLFSGTEGDDAIATYDTSQMNIIKSGNPVVKYGPKLDMLTRFQSLIITLSATTDIVYIYPRHKVFLERGGSVAGSCSVMLDSAQGSVNISTCLLNYYDKTTNGTVSGSVVTLSNTASLNGTIQGPIVEDVLTYLQEAGTALTRSDFVGVEPTWVSQNYTALEVGLVSGYQFSLPALKFTGFTGSIRIALPFWWRI